MTESGGAGACRYRLWSPPTRLLASTRYAPLAQLAEQRTLNPRVRGSSPRRRTGETPSDLGVLAVARALGSFWWAVVGAWWERRAQDRPMCGRGGTSRHLRAGCGRRWWWPGCGVTTNAVGPSRWLIAVCIWAACAGATRVRAGPRTQRRVGGCGWSACRPSPHELRAEVDGPDPGALGVMSEGELPAFAPALRLPRTVSGRVGLLRSVVLGGPGAGNRPRHDRWPGPGARRAGRLRRGDCLLLPRPAAAGYPGDGRATRVVELTSGLGSTVEIASVLDHPVRRCRPRHGRGSPAGPGAHAAAAGRHACGGTPGYLTGPGVDAWPSSGRGGHPPARDEPTVLLVG